MPISNIAVGSSPQIHALVEDQSAVHVAIEGRRIVVGETQVAVADGDEATASSRNARRIRNAQKFIGAIAPNLSLNQPSEAEPSYYPPIFHRYLLFSDHKTLL